MLRDWCDSSPTDAIREAAWIKYFKYNAKQEATLHNLLDKRQKLATSTGQFSEYMLEGDDDNYINTTKYRLIVVIGRLLQNIQRNMIVQNKPY